MPETLSYADMVEEAAAAAAGKTRRRAGGGGFLAPADRRYPQGFFPGRLPDVDVPSKGGEPFGPLDIAALTTGLGPGVAVPAWATAIMLESMTPAEASARFRSLLPGLPSYASSSPGRILRKTREQGGYTVHLGTGEVPESGLLVGTGPQAKDIGIYQSPVVNPKVSIVTGRPPTAEDLAEHAFRNREQFLRDKYFGTWQSPEGATYLDVTRRFEPDEIRQATKFGERLNQREGYNVALGETFPIGNWRDFITTPEFHARMHEMAGQGREYLKAFPTQNWWENLPFRQTYGDELMPNVAGYIAATAPGDAPIRNLQNASEYIRRHIAREPIIQPDWRVPANAVFRNPGSQIGMEASREANLLKASQARDLSGLLTLQREKVQHEGRALLLDPYGVPIDRHWVRLSEAPERGIYASTQEGTIGSRVTSEQPVSPYNALLSEIYVAGDRAGETPGVFSSNVWTGIRNWIQKHNELYGTKFRGSAIPGESKSYADHFTDLKQAVAAEKRMSVKQLERELEKGNANLLSLMLGTPATYAGFLHYTNEREAANQPHRPDL
jgi:hypothetical protein